MKSLRSATSFVLVIVAAIVLLSLGGKADAWAKEPGISDHAMPSGGNAKAPADPDEFDGRRTAPAGRWWNEDRHDWRNGPRLFFIDLADLIDYLFGRKRPL